MLLHRLRAVNTAPESENKIHDDCIAAAYGFRGGLVPGVTVYGYMTLPALEYFGETWLEQGGMSVRFKSPVYDGEEIAIQGESSVDCRLAITIEGRAVASAWLNEAGSETPEGLEARKLPPHDARPPASHESLAQGVVFGTLVKTLGPEDRPISAPLPSTVGTSSIVHPARMLALSNEVLMSNVVLGPWIHASSEVANHATVHEGETVTVRACVAERFERKGNEFAVLDVVLGAAGRVVQTVRHTVIWRLRV